MLLLGTIFLLSQKFTACSYMLWLIIKRKFGMFLWDYLIPWMMLGLCAFLACMERQWMEICFISIEVKRELNLIWLLTMITLYYLCWWLHTSKVTTFDILSLKHYIINISLEAKMLWKIHLAFWKKLQKTTLKTNLHILFLPNVVICYCIIYNMILDGKNLDMEALMVQLDIESFLSYVHQIDLGQR